jgi:NAD(P)-dependent dehydrogenase (short-subunit alcohol dehydrogenase family)
MILKDKVVIISGVGPGMGRAMALGAADEGARVALGARSAAFLEETCAAVRERGGEAIAVATDVRSQEDCQRLATMTLSAFGRIDGLVNSAYFHPPWTGLIDADPADLQQAYDVNCLGALRMVRAVFPAMKRCGAGAIVNVGTLATRKPVNGEGGYAVAKAALGQLTRQLAIELGQHGVRVNHVLMGWMMGAPLEGYLQRLDPKAAAAQRAQVVARIPLGRIPPDVECAKAVYFLLSDYSSEMSGSAMEVNGGEWVSP